MGVDLRGRPIAITGASSGIGAATAVECARAGMPVAIGARREDRLREVAERIRAIGGKVVAVPMDVCREEDCRRLVDAAAEAFGSLYAVFANAGYSVERPVGGMSDEELRAIFECNFFGTMHTVRAALERIRSSAAGAGGRAGGGASGARGGRGETRGHVLICSSCLSKMTVPLVGAYSATKAAQNHVGRAMRLELAGEGIEVSTVHPVGTRTEFFEEMARRSGVDRSVQHVPEVFMQKPERVARAVVRCLRRPRAEVWTSLGTRLGMAACVAFPGVEDFYLKRMIRRAAARGGGAGGA
jgi:short-subunit dehydrogenase